MVDEPKKIAEGLFHLPDSDDDQGYLIGSRCGVCDGVSFPKRSLCPLCLERENVAETRLGREGRLYSFSVNQMAPEGFTAPYVAGKVDLPEKVRVFAVITGVEPEESALAIGQAMELVFGPVAKDESGEPLWGYMFRPKAGNTGRGN